MRKKLALLLTLILIISCVPGISANDTREENIKEAIINEAIIVNEVVENRTEFSKTFRMSDGKHMMVIYPEKVHFKSGENFEEIDNSLIEKANYYENTSNSFKVKFHKNSKERDLISISIDGRNIGWRMEGINRIKSVKNNIERHASDISNDINDVISEISTKPLEDKVIYENIQDGINIEYNVQQELIKENIIISSKDKVKDNYSFRIFTDGLQLRLHEDNNVGFYDENDNELFKFMAPYMIDARGEISFQIEQILETVKESEEYILTIKPSEKWLKEENRMYPVIIDPTFQFNLLISPSKDTTVSSLKKTSSDAAAFGSEGKMYVGKKAISCSSDDLRRSLIRFPLNNIKLPSSITDIKAEIWLRRADSKYCNKEIGLYELTGEFFEGTTNYNNQPGYKTNPVTTYIPGQGNDYDIINVNLWFGQRVIGGADNHGLLLKAVNENDIWSNYVEYYTKDCGIQDFKPCLIVSYKFINTIENGDYYIKNVKTHRYVDIANQSMNDGTIIHQWDYNDTRN